MHIQDQPRPHPLGHNRCEDQHIRERVNVNDDILSPPHLESHAPQRPQEESKVLEDVTRNGPTSFAQRDRRDIDSVEDVPLLGLRQPTQREHIDGIARRDQRFSFSPHTIVQLVVTLHDEADRFHWRGRPVVVCRTGSR